ncbi:MAG: helix-turn-helix transcriptional regulator [Pseudomonadota bacterium]
MQSTTLLDIYIGEKIKELRMMRCLTQEQLATQIWMSCQQLRRHEEGKNPISAARLCHIAEALRVSMEDFIPPEEKFTAL